MFMTDSATASTLERLPTRTISAYRPVSDGERRTPLTPKSVELLIASGWQCEVPTGLGHKSGWSDSDFESAGARVTSEATPCDADVVLCLEPPMVQSVLQLKPGSVLVGLLHPFGSFPIFEAARDAGVSTIAMELIPRSTTAQAMDALSSQASLAGYAAVLRAASRLPRILPMMTTPAGTIPPARILVIGTGVAGLQAIATAVRLGARVTAYDVRPTAKEQVESLGARFANIELDAKAETKDGYAAAISNETLVRQRAALQRLCHDADIIIATAQIFGKPAPVIIERNMIHGMKPGSVIVDLAIGTGGNVADSWDGMDEIIDSVLVLADSHLPAAVAHDASNMFASNIVSLLSHITHDNGILKTDTGNDILNSVLVTHDGQIRHTMATPVRTPEIVLP